MDIIRDTIEIDNKTYIVLETMEIDDNKYYFLSNEEDKTDFFVQKLGVDKTSLVSLDSEEELQKVLAIYSNKYQ